jgi:hypothetical protein
VEETTIYYIVRRITSSTPEEANIAVFYMIKDSLLYKAAVMVFVLASVEGCPCLIMIMIMQALN